MIFISMLTISALAATPKFEDCHAAKEFITSTRFLKSEKIYPAHSPELRNLALEITKGCRGSAQRFKDVFKTLDRAGFPRSNVVGMALEFAKKSDGQTKAFCVTFQKAFLKKYLDMTASDALKVAQSLALNSDDQISMASSDYEKMVSFCVEDKASLLPKQFCAEQAMKLASDAGRYKAGLFKDFKKLYMWNLENSGVDVSRANAMSWALKVTSYGPKAADNFFNSHRFIRSTSDFPLKPSEQIELALKISTESHRLLTTDD